MDSINYGVVKCDSIVFKIPKLMTNPHPYSELNKLEIDGGTLIQIGQKTNDYYYIKIFTIVEKNQLLLSTDMFKCPINHIVTFPKYIWSMLLAIKNKKNRLKIINNLKMINFIRSIKIGSKVTISGEIFSRNCNLHCIVKYIGEIKEFGAGTYFGFLLLDERDSVPVESNFPSRYFNCNNSKAFIRAVDCFLDLNRRKDSNAEKLSASSSASQSLNSLTSFAIKCQPTSAPSNVNKVTKDSSNNKEDCGKSEIEQLKAEIEMLKLKQELLEKNGQLHQSAADPEKGKRNYRRNRNRNRSQNRFQNKPSSNINTSIRSQSVDPNQGPSYSAQTFSIPSPALTSEEIQYFESMHLSESEVLQPIKLYQENSY